LDGAEAAVEGDLEIQGVAGRGAAIRLEFVDPGGAVSGSLLPTSALRNTLDIPGLGQVDVSIVDATAVVAFVRAEAVGLRGDESPQQLETNRDAMAALEEIRRCAAVHTGLAQSAEDAARSLNRPFIALVAPPRDAPTLAGEVIPAASVDLMARALSMGRPHRALPLTAALCLAAAARIEGTLVHDLTRPPVSPNDDLRIGHPSGALPVAARVRRDGEHWIVDGVVAYRTARRLMEGSVLLPRSRVDGSLLP
jgi:2-methylaconitate cis-trans-isomerase PrpF